ncbi:MAG: thioredoxin domain-containing protein, partial [Legionellales bacterium]|nr:thioredoxin domain-containing protein [Legionellales bacterium]
MRLIKITFLLGVFFSSQIVFAAAANEQTIFNKKQKKEIQAIIHNYLLTNPEVLIEASKSLQEKQKKEMLAKIQAEIPKYKKEIFTSNTSPTIGNANGTLYLVEFLDYACGYCRKMHTVVEELIEKNKSVKVILKEFPIFGGASDRAARMALAAHKHGRYAAFHKELLHTEPPLDDSKIDAIVKKLKLDLEKMNKIADSEEVT